MKKWIFISYMSNETSRGIEKIVTSLLAKKVPQITSVKVIDNCEDNVCKYTIELYLNIEDFDLDFNIYDIRNTVTKLTKYMVKGNDIINDVHIKFNKS